MSVKKSDFANPEDVSVIVYLQNPGQIFSLFVYLADSKRQTTSRGHNILIVTGWKTSPAQFELLYELPKVLNEMSSVVSLGSCSAIKLKFFCLSFKHRAWKKLAINPEEIVFGHQLSLSRDVFSLLGAFPNARKISFGDHGIFYSEAYFRSRNVYDCDERRTSTKQKVLVVLQKIRDFIAQHVIKEDHDYLGIGLWPTIRPETLKVRTSIVEKIDIQNFGEELVGKIQFLRNESNIPFPGEPALVVLLPNFSQSKLMSRDSEISLIRNVLVESFGALETIVFIPHPNMRHPWTISEIQGLLVDPGSYKVILEKRHGIPIEFLALLGDSRSHYISFSSATINLNSLGRRVHHGLTEEIAVSNTASAWVQNENRVYLNYVADQGEESHENENR